MEYREIAAAVEATSNKFKKYGELAEDYAHEIETQGDSDLMMPLVNGLADEFLGLPKDMRADGADIIGSVIEKADPDPDQQRLLMGFIMHRAVTIMEQRLLRATSTDIPPLEDQEREAYLRSICTKPKPA